MISPLEIRDQVPLAPYTTLELGGPAQHFARVTDRDQLREALRWASERALPVTLLGSGSNVVISDAGIAGLVVMIDTRGITWQRAADRTLLSAEAGEDWDEIVRLSVQERLAGLECMSGIPGKVGATPIQNVGAYGQEVSQCLDAVEVLDRSDHSARWLNAAECEFDYRTSRFKRQPDRFIVLAVRFALQTAGSPTLRYPELIRALAKADPSLAEVRTSVLALRRGKSMLIEAGDENRRSVGSFFLNPIVSPAQARAICELAQSQALVARSEELPQYPQADGRLKLSAAWLIEHSGTRKGERLQAVGVSSRHSLALVHHGGGSSQQLLALADRIRTRVRTCFEIDLTPEPNLLGFR